MVARPILLNTSFPHFSHFIPSCLCRRNKLECLIHSLLTKKSSPLLVFVKYMVTQQPDLFPCSIRTSPRLYTCKACETLQDDYISTHGVLCHKHREKKLLQSKTKCNLTSCELLYDSCSCAHSYSILNWDTNYSCFCYKVLSKTEKQMQLP